MKEKKKLNIKRVIITVEIIILLTLLILIGVKVYNDFFKKVEENPNVATEKNSIKEFGYKLEDRDTILYEKYYNELKKVLKEKEINYNKYAELLAKLYITDFYTLSNKISSTDIGSLDFIHPDSLENFKIKAGDTIYKTVISNLYNDRTQVLPEVSDINMEDISETKFNYSETEYDAYEIALSWTYVEDMGYDTSKKLTLIKIDKKLYVVSAK